MKWMSSEINIYPSSQPGKVYQFNHVHAFEINSSWKTMTDTARLSMPNIDGFLNTFKVGDAIEIKAGYDGELVTEFTGYIKAFTQSNPANLICEDEMYQLKQRTVTKSWRSVQLKELIDFLVPGVKLLAGDVTLAPFRLDNVTVAQALQKIKDEFLLSVYFRNKDLFVGLPYFERDDMQEHYFHFQKNALIGDLMFKNETDLKIKARAISILPNNTRIIKEYGDPDGDLTTLHFYNKTAKEMDSLALEQIQRSKYSGYKGSFICFGQPQVLHSDLVFLYNRNYPTYQDGVFIDSVKTMYNGSTGFTRTLQAGQQFFK